MSEQANQRRKVNQLSDDVDFIYKSLGRIEQTQKHHSVRFAGVESHLDALAVGQRQIREDMTEVKTRLGGVETGLDGVDTKLVRVLVLLGEPGAGRSPQREGGQ